MAVKTGERAPDFDLEVKFGERARLSDFLGKSNVLLVFHPFAFTAVCEEEARDLQENLASFRNAQTEIVLVSCDPAPARQAWKAYGVFNEQTGAPFRGTFLIAKDGTVVWSLVKAADERRTEMVPESLEALEAGKSA